jgi:HEAT repeat protein
VAGGHDSPLVREAAVAALGAVGAPETLAVVLDALGDTVNIRRRAAIALAAFDDPAAEEGLRRCLGDRDWQVRQAAAALLAGD